MIDWLPHQLMVVMHVHLGSRDKLLLHHVLLHQWATIRVVRDSLCVARLGLLDKWDPLHHIPLMLMSDRPLDVVLLRCISWGTTLVRFWHAVTLTPIRSWRATLGNSIWTVTLGVIETGLGSLVMSTLGGRTKNLRLLLQIILLIHRTT
jgi:hypothetical protein